MTYSISQFAKLTKLSIHTLRYYEAQDLIRVQRDKHHHRVYTQENLEWIFFIRFLQASGMSLKEIRVYALLFEQGDKTLLLRLKILKDHRSTMAQALGELQQQLERIDKKIMHEECMISNRIKESALK